LALVVADLVETVSLVWPRSATSPLGAPLDVAEVWKFSALVAVVVVLVLTILYRVRSTKAFTWIAAAGLAMTLLSSFALLWTGHLLTLLIALGAFAAFLFVPPERPETPDEAALLRPREHRE
jgi:hypothetical protein